MSYMLGDIYKQVSTGRLWTVNGTVTSYNPIPTVITSDDPKYSSATNVLLADGTDQYLTVSERDLLSNQFELVDRSVVQITTLRNQLEKMMRQISEDLYAASWAYNLEFEIWDAVQGKPVDWSTTEFFNELKYMEVLSKICNGWFSFKDNQLQFVCMPEWLEIYNKKGK